MEFKNRDLQSSKAPAVPLHLCWECAMVPAGAGALSQPPGIPWAASQEKGTPKAWNLWGEVLRPLCARTGWKRGTGWAPAPLRVSWAVRLAGGMERLRIPDVKCRIGASRPHCSSLHELLQLLKSFKWVTPLTDQGPDLKFPFLLSQTALACTDSTVTLTFRCNCCQKDACWSHLFPRLKLGLNWWNKEKMGNSSEEVQGRENLSERARCYTENFEGK